MSNEKWSSWIKNRGIEPKQETVQVKFKDGDTDEDHASAYYWGIDHDDADDIIAYRYKIKEPESDMHPDLKKCAQYEWNGNFDRVTWNHSVAGPEWFNSKYFTGKDGYKRSEHSAARQQLGLDPTGIADPDEEECLQLAYERMGDESVKVSIDELQDNVNKPKHYQLRDGYEVYDLRQDLAAKAANGGATYGQYSDWDRAIEYIVRMWGKNRLEDAKKGRWYLDKLIGKLEDQG